MRAPKVLNGGDDTPNSKYSPKHMVICGGGAKGKAYKSALQIANDCGILGNIENYYGSSVGGLTASMLAMGMSLDEINKQLDAGPETLSDMFRTSPISDLSTPIKGIKNLIQSKAVYKGYKLFEMSQSIVAKQLGTPNATFKDLQEKVVEGESAPTTSGRKYGYLYVTATVMDKRGPYQIVLSHETVPNMPIALALRMTAALPYAFPSIKITPEELETYRGKATTPLVQYDRGEGYDTDTISPTTNKGAIEICDGGLVDNLPQYLVQKDGAPNREMISLNLAHPTYIQHKKDYQVPNKVTNESEVNFLKSQKRSLYYAAKEKYKEMKKVRPTPSRLLITRDTTADFDTDNIMASDFDLSDSKKQHLDESGKTGINAVLFKQGILSELPQEKSEESDEQLLKTISLEPNYQAQSPESELDRINKIIESADAFLDLIALSDQQKNDLDELKEEIKSARKNLDIVHQTLGQAETDQYKDIKYSAELIKGIFFNIKQQSIQIETALNEASNNLSKANYVLFKLCNKFPKLDLLLKEHDKNKHDTFSQLREMKDIDKRLKLAMKLIRPKAVDPKRSYVPLKDTLSDKKSAPDLNVGKGKSSNEPGKEKARKKK